MRGGCLKSHLFHSVIVSPYPVRLGGRGPELAEHQISIMSVSGLAGRYATALFELAQETGKLAVVEADLRSLTAMLGASTDLMRAIRSPVFTRAQQGAAIEAILQAAGADDLTRRFAGLLAAKRRLFALPQIIGDFTKLLAHQRGEVTAQVTSAQALDAGQMAALKTALTQAAGRDVTVQAGVEPGILGGLIVRMGSRMIDSSLRTKLNNMQLAMKEVG